MRTTTVNRRPAKPKTEIKVICAKCDVLNELPDFTETLIKMHKLTQQTVEQWYHLNEHVVYKK